MTFFNWSMGGSGGETVSQWVWIYVVFTVVFTLATLAVWYYLVVYRERRGLRRNDEEEGLTGED
jgi:hypothetical protein